MKFLATARRLGAFLPLSAGLLAMTAMTAITAISAIPAAAQTFPNRPVRTVLPYSAGSGPDALIRAIGEKMSHDLGQGVVIDNKPGGNGWLAIADVKRSPADGYTMLMCDANIMTLQQSLFKHVPFDPVKDFEPIAPIYSTSYFIVVNANSPWKNLGDLLAAARKKQDDVTFATWGIGSPGHIGTAMLESGAGVKFRHIPYKDIPAVYLAVANGEVDWAFGSAGSIAPLYQAKKIKVLAYTGAKRLPTFPDVPTLQEEGGKLSDFELSTWAALYAARGTPKPAMDRLNASLAKALEEPEIKQRMNTFGFTQWMVSPAEFTKAADADRKKYGDIIRRLNISLD